MSLCSPCQQCEDVPLGFSTLRIGTVANNNTAYYVYMLNLATGVETRYDVTSSAAGLISLDRESDNVQLSHGMYQVSAVLTASYNLNTDVNITVGGTAYACLKFKTADVFDDTGAQLEYDIITLQV